MHWEVMAIVAGARGAGGPLASEARRLAISNSLTRACIELMGGIPDPSSAEALIDAAQELSKAGIGVEQSHRVKFDPPFPGVGEVPCSTMSGSRLLLVCRVLWNGSELGVAYTTLLPNRLPQVSVGPPAFSIPSDWKPPSRMLGG